ncbi:hypothetical protein TVAG_303330 [Trichomonas vaginalis G3]|uniref:Uncharacterized protein n=1 Tax=Trichomonas vaginalis (strain ATCC PRA-98 / G3) TaxID=412133 RepID=A2DR15_TRIV3|nr:regulation of cell shape [Trichomonas vaginalis G3]EAY17114.1 hypothetical protein TVAG_303330 [Trichomonas vaginalis G3]KAI5508824.1 regulation of cell shape [Trichomonas vaginalis G3]|eukprot:XP_001329337.1 hypothetical protein [Trichomonas vaginalis G3]
MDDDSQRELYFLIAKLLKISFPEIGNSFIEECERRKLFPSCVFSKNPTFHELDSHSLSGIPNDQLMRLVSMALPKSQFPSLFITPPNKDQHVSIADILTKQLGPPLPLCYGMTPSHRIVGHFHSIYCLTTDITSQILISGSDDSLIKIWKIPELTLIATVHAHRHIINDIDIHPSNLFFASAAQDCQICITSLKTLAIQSYSVSYYINCVKFSPDGKYLCAAYEDGYVRLSPIDPYTGAILGIHYNIEIPDHKMANWVCFSPGSQFFSFISATHSIVIVNVNEPKYQVLSGLDDDVDTISFSRQTGCKLLAHSPKEKSIRVYEERGGIYQETWDVAPRNIQNTRQKPIKAYWNADETRIVAITTTQIVAWTDPYSTPLTETVTYGTEHCSVLALHPTKPEIAFVGCDNGHASIWDINKMEAICKMQADQTIYGITEAIWSPDGQYVFAADAMGGITVYGHTTQPFTTTQQVFIQDDDRAIVNVSSQAIFEPILNAAKLPLDPQPVHYNLESMMLNVQRPEADSRIVVEEKQVLEKWRNLPQVREFGIRGDTHVWKVNFDDETNERNAEEEEDEDEEVAQEQTLSNSTSRHQIDNDDADFNIAAIQQEFSDEDDESESINSPQEEAPLPKTRSSGPVDETIRPRSKRRTTIQRQSSIVVDDDNIIQDDDQDLIESESEAMFSDEEEMPVKPPPKSPKKSSSSSRNRSRHSRSHDDYIKDDFINDDEEFDIKKSIDSDSLSDDYDTHQVVRATRRNTRIPDSPPPIALPVVNTPMPPWMYNTKRSQYQFVPQKGENVIYLKEIHKKLANDCAVSIYEPPYRKNRTMPDITQARIKGIQIDPDYLIISLEFLNLRNIKEGIVAFPKDDSQPFLVPEDLFNRSMERAKNFKKGDPVSVAFSEDGKLKFYDAKIVDVRSDFERNPDSSITVELDEGSGNFEFSPWEIQIDDGPLSETAQFGRTLANYGNHYKETAKYKPFVSLRSDEIKDKIWKNLSFPMDLDLFFQRLDDGWYQTIDEMFIEADLFQVNAPLLGLNEYHAQDLSEALKQQINIKSKTAGISPVYDDYI